MNREDFHTFSEYMKKEDDSMTASMEDYLEMIYRLSENLGFTRVHDLADSLSVQPPSATKMIQKLSDIKLVDYERYGIVVLTQRGKDMGKYLLNRHNTIEAFLKLLGVNEDLLEETEKIEHTISTSTLECLDDLIKFIDVNPDVIGRFKEFKESKR